MMYAETRSACQKKRDEFVLRFKKTDPKACATLTRDWERLVSFFDYPQEHWKHLRTTNIVESPFDQVRLRTDASRRFKKTENAEAMIWKLLCVAEKSWRALNAPHLMKDVYEAKRFKDGVACKRERSRRGKPPKSFYTPIDGTSVFPWSGLNPLALASASDMNSPCLVFPYHLLPGQ